MPAASADMTRRKGLRPCTLVWLLLVGLTGVTFAVGEAHLSGLGIVAFVLAMTLLKAQLVAGWFMGLRQAPLLWRLVVGGYLTVVGGGIAVAYLIGLS
jgi:cytochrome c oxidase subunit 4